MTRRTLDWVMLALASLLVIGLIAYGRGAKHHEGDEIGSHGTQVHVDHVVP